MSMEFEGGNPCLKPLKDAAAAAGRALSDAEAMDVLSEVQARADSMRRDRPDLSEAELRVRAAEELNAEEVAAARRAALNAKRNLVKRVRRREGYAAAPEVKGKITGHVTPGPVVGLEAKLVGTNTVFDGSRLSVEARQKALEGEWLGGMAVDLERAGVLRMVRRGRHDRDIARELYEVARIEGGRPGVTGNAAALKAAQVVHKYQRAAVEALNREGAWIGQYDGYIARTAHDPDMVRRAGFEAWRDRIVPLLDHDRTFGDVTDRDRFLRGVWEGLTTGVHLTTEGVAGFKDPAFRGPANIAKKLSKGRVLHFRDADAWMDYHDDFGRVGLMESVLQSLRASAQAAGLMKEFGTNPKAEFLTDVQWLKETYRADNPAVAAELSRLIDTESFNGYLANLWKNLDGTASRPVDQMVATIGAGVRLWQATAKLGGVLASSVTDIAVKAKELRYQGVGVIESYADGFVSVVRGRGRTEEQREIADLLLAGVEGMISNMAARFDGTNTPPGVMSRTANIYFRLTGLTYWTDAQKTGTMMVMSRHLGRQLGSSFADLAPQTRRAFTASGITPDEWEAIRGVDMATIDGRAFLTPDRARLVPDDAVDSVIGDRLDAIRTGAVERAERAAAAVERLGVRLQKLQQEVDRPAPDMGDVEAAALAGGRKGTHRYQETIETLRQHVRDQRDGKRTPTEVGQAIAREIGALARAERAIAEDAANRVRRLLEKIPAAEARRAEMLGAMDRARDEMIKRLDEIEGLPAWMEMRVAEERTAWREDLAMRLHAFFRDRADFAVLTPGARTRAVLYQGAQTGTPLGEAWRTIMQFKAFPVAMLEKVWGRELYGRADEPMPRRAAGVFHMMAAGLVFGGIAMTLKDLFKGREPRWSNAENWQRAEMYYAAMAQGGGLGIYGDFLLGSWSRTGNTALEQMAGPTSGSVANLVNLWARTRDGDGDAASLLRWGINNMPGGNLFYARVAIDYALIYQLQEMLNPGYLRRMERRMKEEQGQSFVISPASAIPHGGGGRVFEGLR